MIGITDQDQEEVSIFSSMRNPYIT